MLDIKIKKIAKKYGLKLVLLFGSQATKKIHKQSDIDIAFLSEKKLSLNEEVNLIFDLTQILRSENIDLVNLRTAPPLLLYAISRHSVVLYQKNALIFPEFCAYAFKYYVEAKPIFELQKILL